MTGGSESPPFRRACIAGSRKWGPTKNGNLNKREIRQGQDRRGRNKQNEMGAARCPLCHEGTWEETLIMLIF